MSKGLKIVIAILFVLSIAISLQNVKALKYDLTEARLDEIISEYNENLLEKEGELREYVKREENAIKFIYTYETYTCNYDFSTKNSFYIDFDILKGFDLQDVEYKLADQREILSSIYYLIGFSEGQSDEPIFYYDYNWNFAFPDEEFSLDKVTYEKLNEMSEAIEVLSVSKYNSVEEYIEAYIVKGNLNADTYSISLKKLNEDELGYSLRFEIVIDNNADFSTYNGISKKIREVIYEHYSNKNLEIVSNVPEYKFTEGKLEITEEKSTFTVKVASNQNEKISASEVTLNFYNEYGQFLYTMRMYIDEIEPGQVKEISATTTSHILSAYKVVIR